jgi:membrane-associated phospholipid phosphatase
MLHDLWTRLLWRITSLGDIRFALPIAAILVIWLCTRRRWQTAIWYTVAVLGCGAAILFLKLAVFSGDLQLAALGLQNPSGHSAVAAVVYGSFAWLLWREMPDWRGRALWLLACAGVAAIGASLYVVRAHTLADVFVGLTLGSGCALAFAWLNSDEAAPAGASPPPVRRLLLVVALVAMSLQAVHLMPRLTPTGLLLRVTSLSAPA